MQKDLQKSTKYNNLYYFKHVGATKTNMHLFLKKICTVNSINGENNVLKRIN